MCNELCWRLVHHPITTFFCSCATETTMFLLIVLFEPRTQHKFAFTNTCSTSRAQIFRMPQLGVFFLICLFLIQCAYFVRCNCNRCKRAKKKSITIDVANVRRANAIVKVNYGNPIDSCNRELSLDLCVVLITKARNAIEYLEERPTNGQYEING